MCHPTAALAGTGMATRGAVTLSPGSVDFGLLAESASTAKTIQITNSGTGALHISNIALSGSNPADFSQTNNCVSIAIAVQASCTITATFTSGSTSVQGSTQLTVTLANLISLAISPANPKIAPS